MTHLSPVIVTTVVAFTGHTDGLTLRIAGASDSVELLYTNDAEPAAVVTTRSPSPRVVLHTTRV
jgi:hypothetical protein